MNASSQPRLRGEVPQTARVNYIRGNDASKWLTGVPTYGQLTYDDVWPGIDLRFKGAAGTFKYEFVVKPGAHPSDIVLAYEGARTLALDAKGNLLIETESSSLMDTRPVAFLDGTPETAIDADFVLGSNGSYRFDVAPYDSKRTLVIDPGIVWATYLGTTYDISRVVLRWEDAYAAAYALQISNDNRTWNTFRNVSKSSNGVDDLGVSAVGRYVRMFAFQRGTPYGVSLWEFEVYGFPVSFGANLTRSGTASASSIENSSFTPDKAIDGNLATRWSSAFADSQSIVIDRGSVQPVRRVILRWEAAYAKSYLLQYSNNPAVEGYFAVASQSNGQGGVEDWAWNTEATARYIRVYCATRATPYGFSLFEVEVYAVR